MALAGSAFVKFQGDYSGLATGAAGAGGKAGKVAGAGFSKSLVKGLAVGGVAAAAIATGLFKVGQEFDKSYDKIRVGTGATGKALEGLKGDFKAVATTVPTSLDGASTAVADLNTRLGLTGKPLQDLSGKFINLSRVTGTDLTGNIDSLTRMFGDAGLAPDEFSGALDKVYRAAQSSGIGIDELAQSATTFGAPMRNLGFSFDESLGLLAKFNKEGVNTETVFAGLKAGVGKLAKEGEPVPETFSRVVGEIKKMGPGTEATAKAIDLFGQRAGPDLADSIAGGKFEIDDMMESIVGGSDTINKAAKDTESFGEKWQLFKNKILVALEPIAIRVFDFIGAAMDRLPGIVGGVVAAFQSSDLPGIIGAIAGGAKDLWSAFQDALPTIIDLLGQVWSKVKEVLPPIVAAVGDVVDGFKSFADSVKPVVSAIADFVAANPGPVLAGLGAVVLAVAVPAFIAWASATWALAAAWIALNVPTIAFIALIALVVGAVVYAYQNFDWFRTGVDAAWQAIQTAADYAWNSVIKPVFAAISSWVTGTLIPVFRDQLWPAIQTAWAAIQTAVTSAWNNVIKPVFTALWSFITGTLVPIFQTIWSVVQTVFGAIQTAISFAWNNIIKPVFQALWAFITNVLVPIFKAFLAVGQFVFSLLWAAVQDAWRIIQPIFTAVVGFIRDTLVPRFNAFKDAAVIVFDAVWSAVKSAWDFIKPIFEKVVAFVKDKLAPVWETISSAVSTAFGAIPGAIQSALRTAGNIVAGFMRGVAGIADAIGLDNIAGALRSGADKADGWGEGKLPNTKPHSRGGAFGLAEGGFISGGTPGKDSVPAMLMPGEVVIRKAMVDRYGADNLLAMNAGKVPGYKAGGQVLGRGQLEGLARGAGISNTKLASAVALAESGGDPDAFNRNRNGSVDRGLWQINSIHGALSTFDPGGNARAAASISGGGRNWNPWVAYTTGSYRKFMGGGGQDLEGIPQIRVGDARKGSIASDLLKKLRDIAAGALEKMWPKMDVASGLLGLPAGGLNYARSSIIDFIRDDAKKQEDAENAKETGKSGSSGLAGSSKGLDPEFLRRFNTWNAATGGRYGIGAGWRSYERQVYFWNLYKSGRGNLAAVPGTSNHGRGLAIDTTPRVSAADQALARQFKLHFPVRGEPWHIEPFAQGGQVAQHRNSFDSGGVLAPGWNMVRNDTGAPEDVRPTGRGDAPLIGEAHFHDGVDLDLVAQKLDRRLLAGSL